MSWKQLRIFVLALIFGAILVVLLKVILVTLSEKGKGKSATMLPSRDVATSLHLYQN